MSRNEAWLGLLLFIYLIVELALMYAYQRAVKRRRDELPKGAANGRPYVPTRRERILAVGLCVYRSS